MSCDAPLQEGAIGVAIKVQLVRCDPATGILTPIDLSAATNLEIVFLPPRTSVGVVKAAALSTDGLDGFIEWVTVAGFLTPTGEWAVQGFADIDGTSIPSEPGSFLVAKNIPRP